MEKKTLDHFKQIIAKKYDCINWDNLCLNINFKATGVPYSIQIASDEAAKLYHEYGREDQHKIATNTALEWAADNAKTHNQEDGVICINNFTKQSILKGKTDKSLQYGSM